MSSRKKESKDDSGGGANSLMDTYIYHHGIKGMKWGIRRYQNKDGSLTPAGKKRRMGAISRTAVKGVAKLHGGISNFQKRSAKNIRKDAKDIRDQKSKMLSLRDRKNRALFTEKDIDDMINALDRKASAIESKARNHERYANQLLSEIEKIKVRDLKR